MTTPSMAPPRAACVSARVTGDGVLVPVRLTPKARHNNITGIADDADGTRRLKVSVTAVPEGGRANAALINLLAKFLGVPKSAVSIKSGATARAKTVLVACPPETLLARIEKEMQEP